MMNNAHLYTLVTKLEEAERAHLLAGQRRSQQALPGRVAAVIAQVTALYQRWTTGKPAAPGGIGWDPAHEATVDQPLGVE